MRKWLKFKQHLNYTYIPTFKFIRQVIIVLRTNFNYKFRISNTEFNMQIEAMKTQRVYIEIYPEMLSRVKNYHKEFIDKYNELQQKEVTDVG